MGSFGLPALAIKPPEQNDPLQEVGKLAQLKSAMQQQQAGQVSLQQQKQALADQQAATAAMHDWDGKDFTQLPSLMLKHGASATAVIGMKQHILTQQETLSKMAQQDAETGSKNVATTAAKNNLALGQLQTLNDVPDEQLGQQLTKVSGDLANAGLIDPQHAQAAQQLSQLPAPQLRKALALYEKSMMGQKEQFDQAQKSLETNATVYQKTMQGNEANIKSQQGQLTLQGTNAQGVTAAQQQEQTSRAQALTIQAKNAFTERQRAQEAARHNTVEEAQGQTKVDIEQKKLTAGVIPLDQVTNTTKAGRNYISMEDLPKDKFAADAMRKQAAEAGTPIVNKATAGMLSDIDTAKENQQYMLDTIGKKLASGAATRPWFMGANTIEKMMQTDPEMASVGTFRSAAIQSMRAVAGSAGLRMNKSEIETAQENDIPKLTDTLPVAQQKLKNMGQFLEDIEAAHLNRNRQSNAPKQVQSPQVGTGGPSVGAVENGYRFKGGDPGKQENWMKVGP